MLGDFVIIDFDEERIKLYEKGERIVADITGEKEIYSFVKGLQDLLPGRKKIWKDYDEEADVLYLNFRKPPEAKDSIIEGDIFCHYDDEELVGITVLNMRKNI